MGEKHQEIMNHQLPTLVLDVSGRQNLYLPLLSATVSKRLKYDGSATQIESSNQKIRLVKVLLLNCRIELSKNNRKLVFVLFCFPDHCIFI